MFPLVIYCLLHQWNHRVTGYEFCSAGKKTSFKQHCFEILFHMFPLVIYCLLHQWNHQVTGYEFCNRVEPKLEPKPITTSTHEQGSDQFISFNSIQFQFKLDSGFFKSIQFQFKLDSESFNSIPIQFIFFQFQFNSIQFLCTVINKLIEYFKFNLNISLFAAQFRKYIIQDHNNSRINKSALVQVLG